MMLYNPCPAQVTVEMMEPILDLNGGGPINDRVARCWKISLFEGNLTPKGK